VAARTGAAGAGLLAAVAVCTGAAGAESLAAIGKLALVEASSGAGTGDNIKQ
jgi:hypothetical protein